MTDKQTQTAKTAETIKTTDGASDNNVRPLLPHLLVAKKLVASPQELVFAPYVEDAKVHVLDLDGLDDLQRRNMLWRHRKHFGGRLYLEFREALRDAGMPREAFHDVLSIGASPEFPRYRNVDRLTRGRLEKMNLQRLCEACKTEIQYGSYTSAMALLQAMFTRLHNIRAGRVREVFRQHPSVPDRDRTPDSVNWVVWAVMLSIEFAPNSTLAMSNMKTHFLGRPDIVEASREVEALVYDDLKHKPFKHGDSRAYAYVIRSLYRDGKIAEAKGMRDTLVAREPRILQVAHTRKAVSGVVGGMRFGAQVFSPVHVAKCLELHGVRVSDEIARLLPELEEILTAAHSGVFETAIHKMGLLLVRKTDVLIAEAVKDRRDGKDDCRDGKDVRRCDRKVIREDGETIRNLIAEAIAVLQFMCPRGLYMLDLLHLLAIHRVPWVAIDVDLRRRK